MRRLQNNFDPVIPDVYELYGKTTFYLYIWQQKYNELLILNLATAFTSYTMVKLTHIFPFFIVTGLKTSVSFYVDKLGFEIRYMGPDDNPYWAIVGRDNISIMLKEIAPGIKPIPNHTRHEWAPWDAYIATTEPDTLFEEFRSNGVTFSEPIHDNSDNLRGFEIEDADGYILFFGRPNP